MQAPDHRLKSDDHTVGTSSQTSRQYNIALQGRFMPEVIIGSSASFEQGLKQFNKLVQLSGILREARQRQYFEPPSVVRKRKAATKLRKSLKAARLESGRGLKYGAAKRKPGPAVKTRR
jgi:small subunit ribosomal protein S21